MIKFKKESYWPETIFLILILILTGYFIYQYLPAKDCSSDGYCFEEALKSCKKVLAMANIKTQDGSTANIQLKIEGKSGDYCKISFKYIFSEEWNLINTIKYLCLIKKETILYGKEERGKLSNMESYLENCKEEREQ